MAEFGPDWLNAIKKAYGLKKYEHLLSMAPQNDPFNTGGDGYASTIEANWFMDIWERFGFTRGIHLRRIHYRLVSEATVRKPDGTLYQNTNTDWQYIAQSSKHARDLDLLGRGMLIDQRNPDPTIIYDAHERDEQKILPEEETGWELPEIRSDAYFDPWIFTYPSLSGYIYQEEDQPYFIEIWVEKSTMNDILIPLCRQNHVNLVGSLGFFSDIAIDSYLDRVANSGRPGRILYISDLDKAGDKMPKQVSRRIQHKLHKWELDLDIALDPVILTRAQADEYQLPSVPTKDKVWTEGVELDALEALHPGAFQQIVEARINELRDGDLEEKMRQTSAMAHVVRFLTPTRQSRKSTGQFAITYVKG